ncbi:MAG TPA: LD-carboxypeptidase [Patescibacteria group bacterium]|nr:LD-carboxypeptidase [Patescibacteria group bacterium]
MKIEKAIKPPALVPGSHLRIVATAGPVEEERLRRGAAEIERLGYRPAWNPQALAREGYFAGPQAMRAEQLSLALADPQAAGIVPARGGYGTAYLLDALHSLETPAPKALIAFSDLTLLLNFAWRRWNWVTFYGPMVAAGFHRGAGSDDGYDEPSFRLAVTETRGGWELPLQGETLREGETEGRVLGGCLTLLRGLIGTPWEPDTSGAILLIEDLNMKPYQVDRALMHLKLAGKLDGVRGFLLGDFPGCEPPADDGPAVCQVVERLLVPLGVPVVWGAPLGHTHRPMLTVPLGVRARLVARGSGRLDILEPAVVSR